MNGKSFNPFDRIRTCSLPAVSLCGGVTGLMVLMLAGCVSSKGHETDALGGSIGKARQSAVATGTHIRSAQNTTQQIDDELQELLGDSEP